MLTVDLPIPKDKNARIILLGREQRVSSFFLESLHKIITSSQDENTDKIILFLLLLEITCDGMSLLQFVHNIQ